MNSDSASHVDTPHQGDLKWIEYRMPKRLRRRDKLQQIYALIDLRDNKTRYVGRSDDVSYRYYQRLQGGDGRQTKYWIRELLQQGLSPILQIL